MEWIVILLISSVALIGNSLGDKKNEDALLKELDQLLNAAHQTDKREQKIQKKNVQCGASTSLQSGDITSPGYPGNYRSNENCVYTIIVPGTADINIEFKVLGIEYETNCGYDAVILPQPLGTELRVCGLNPAGHHYDIRGVTGQYSIRFKSDYSQEGQGFLLHYIVNGGGFPNPNPNPNPNPIPPISNTGPCPSFTCPNFCESGFAQPCSHCACAANQPTYGYQKCGTQTSCSCGFRVNSNGCPVCMCAANVSPTTLVTPHNTCNMVLDEVSSTFASPNWPSTYPNNAMCTITLRIPPGGASMLYLNFQYIQLQDSANCLYESISFGHVKICGSGPRSYVIPGVSGDFVITFSGSMNYGDGFFADYRITGSGYPNPNPNPYPNPNVGVDRTHVLGKLNELYMHAQEAVARAQEVSTAIQQLISEVQNSNPGYNGNPYPNGNPYGNNPYNNNGNHNYPYNGNYNG